MSLDGLTFKQRLFVEAFLGPSAGNAVDAARRAGYRWPQKVAERLVGKSGIAAAISARIDSAALTTSQMLAILSDHATVSIEDFGDIDEYGFRLRLDKAKARRRAHCVKKIKPVRVRIEDDAGGDGPPRYQTEYEIELYDAQAAIEKLGKFRGIWKDRDQTPAAADGPHTIPEADPRFLGADGHPADAGAEGPDAAEGLDPGQRGGNG